MGFFDWFSRGKKPPTPTDPVKAFDLRIDALAGRAGALRKSAATLLTVRRDLDRKLEGVAKQVEIAKTQHEKALGRGDTDSASVLHQDQERFERDRTHLMEQKAKVTADAEALTAAVTAVEGEVEGLRRERDSARVRLAAVDVLQQSRSAVEERIEQILQLDAARDEIERAHALAEIYREEAQAKREREGG